MRRLALALLLTITACGRDEAAGGLSREDSDRLNEAAAMLDEEPALIENALAEANAQ